MNLRTALASTVAISAIAVPSVAVAQERNFDVPAQTAVTSIPELARQADVQILVSESVVKGKRTKAVRGKMTVRQALGKLLSGTGIRVTSGDGRTFTLAGQIGPSAEGNDPEPVAVTAEADEAQSSGISEILVVGSKSQNVDIRRTEDDAQPYVVFSSEEIENSQATNLDEFLRRRLPMNTAATSASQNSESDIGLDRNNISSVNLRGLGTAQTLILVDGRRVPRQQTARIESVFTQGDLNGIPLSSIERIEVLPSTAGGIYGGGAVGGVINVIRKRNYEALDVRVSGEGAFRGGGESVRIEANGGFGFNDNRTRISASGSYAKAEPLHVDENELWRRGRNLWIKNLGYGGETILGVPLGATPNIIALPIGSDAACRAAGGSFNQCAILPNLVLDIDLGGASLNAPFTHVSEGYGGFSRGNAATAASLVSNAGSFNLDIPNNIAGRQGTLAGGFEVWSANLNIRHELKSGLDLFADVGLQSNNSRSSFGTGVANITLPAAAATNPFQQAVIVAIPVFGLAGDSKTTITSRQASAGVIAKLGSSWSAIGEYHWSDTKRDTRFPKYPILTAQSGLIAALRDGRLNPIADVENFPLNYDSYLPDVAIAQFGPSRTTQELFSLKSSGKTISLPGGRGTATLLLERREEAAKKFKDSTPNDFTGTITTEIVPERSQRVLSAYGELMFPILGEDNDIPLMREVELQVSARHDDYKTRYAVPNRYNNSTPPSEVEYRSTQIASTDYTAAVKWSPAKGLHFRASYSTGFLPASINQLVQYQNTASAGSYSFFQDPRRQNAPLSQALIIRTGGNPSLDPEESKSISLGAIVAPPWIAGFRISLDFLRIKKTREIGNIDIVSLLNNEDLFDGRITRAPITDADRALGYEGGLIEVIDASLINIARSSVKAIDIQVDYSAKTKFGLLRMYGMFTKHIDSKRQDAPTLPSTDSVGYRGGPLNWRGNFGFDFSHDNWAIYWNSQVSSSYDVRSPLYTPSLATITVQRQGSERIPSQIYHDIGFRYQLRTNKNSLWNGVTIYGGVQNIFDTKPPALATLSFIGGSSPYGDSRLRRFSFGISKHFGR
ncbi:TonB-dependent receptor domain-containing protein [Sphingorhabdus contaminans]|nr:TonB-dependent receptor [Sphingorhabdus contaminans]